MVDLQSVSISIAALSVFLGVIYYIVNLRETTRNRRVTLTNMLLQSFVTEEGMKRFFELLNMEWTDFDDFYKKYATPENFFKITTFCNRCEVVGYQYVSGMLDMGTLWSVCTMRVPWMWIKFGAVIEEYRRTGEMYRHQYEYFEYLAFEMSKIMAATDPNWKFPPVFKSEEYYREFRKRKPFFISP